MVLKRPRLEKMVNLMSVKRRDDIMNFAYESNINTKNGSY